MLKCEILEVAGFQPALHGMRNPMNSWDKSDTVKKSDCEFINDKCSNREDDTIDICIGQNDLDLMKRLFNAGTEHRKYLRMIQVYIDITAPLYWWKEFDTYKVGTVANSCSTMHKIHDKEFTLDDFSCEHLITTSMSILKDGIIPELNADRELYIETKNKIYWWNMIQLLPSSYNQKRAVMLNYETVFNIIKQRSGHKLDEWHTLIEVLKQLPYVNQILGG